MIDRWASTWFADLKRVDDGAARRAVWRAAYDPVWKSPAYFAIALALQVGVQVLIGPVGLRSLRPHWSCGEGTRFVIQVAGAVIAVQLTVWLVRRRITLNIRRELDRRGLPTCLRCGYNLFGNTSGACPECGKPVN